jgi:hypothetical protein
MIFRASTLEKESPEIIRADHAADLTQYKERSQRNGPDYSERHDPTQLIDPDLHNARGNRLAVPYSDEHVLVDQASNSAQQVRDGKIRAYAVTAKTRVTAFPNIQRR